MTNIQTNNEKQNVACVILAAGQGTRMKSVVPKVMHKLAGFPMVYHVVQACEALGAAKIIPVIAPNMSEVAAEVAPYSCAVQEKPMGTGDAARAALSALEGFGGDVLVVFGDTPLLTTDSLNALIEAKTQNNAQIVVSGFSMDQQGVYKYGRLITEGNSCTLKSIIEDADANEEQKKISFYNGGIMLFAAGLLGELLADLKTDNAQGEYYLTDCVELANSRGKKVVAVELPEEDVRGVNTRAQLAEVDVIMQRRLREAHMLAGVTMYDPSSVYLCADTKLGKDVEVEPHVVFGKGVQVEEGALIRAFSHIEEAKVGKGAQIGPYARLRPAADIREGARIGNFVEVKKAVVEAGAKVNHLSYVGDAEVGAKANIGAGTITCNYDGYNKSKTVIGKGAFIGSNSILVAPVEVGDGAMTAAGSVITKSVKADALAVSRAGQKSYEGWAAKFRAKKEK